MLNSSQTKTSTSERSREKEGRITRGEQHIWIFLCIYLLFHLLLGNALGAVAPVCYAVHLIQFHHDCSDVLSLAGLNLDRLDLFSPTHFVKINFSKIAFDKSCSTVQHVSATGYWCLLPFTITGVGSSFSALEEIKGMSQVQLENGLKEPQFARSQQIFTQIRDSQILFKYTAQDLHAVLAFFAKKG